MGGGVSTPTARKSAMVLDFIEPGLWASWKRKWLKTGNGQNPRAKSTWTQRLTVCCAAWFSGGTVCLLPQLKRGDALLSRASTGTSRTGMSRNILGKELVA